jgi:peptidoglycan/xylan/chitin deacetylase (PgdA/CDA1 family)
MSFLSEAGFNVITLEQFINFREENENPPENSLIITFDDGTRDNYLVAFPILNEFKFSGVFFLVTDYINETKVFSWLTPEEHAIASSQDNQEYWRSLNNNDILEMSAEGACFGSHTKSHCNLTSLESNERIHELEDSKMYLEKLLNKQVKCFAYPYGKMNKAIQRSVQKSGYKSAVSLIPGSNTVHTNPYALRRILIYGQDSLSTFKRKVEGYYDWTVFLLPVYNIGRWIVDKFA